MAYQMKGNKNPGSSYKNEGPGEKFTKKGLAGSAVTYDADGNAINPDASISELTKGTTVLPEVEIGSDGSSKINFDSSTNKGIETLYTGEREGEGTGAMKRMSKIGEMGKGFRQSFSEFMESKTSKGRDKSSPSIHDLVSTSDEPLNYSHGEINQMRQKKMDAGNLSNIAKQSSKFLTDPTYTLTKKSGKEKVITKKRHDKLSAKFEKKKAKGKTPKRSVSDASIVERIMSKGKNKP